MTTNHDYNTPEQGTNNWDVPLNENFERIDTGVEIRDEDENRTNYEPKEGAKFLATDTKTVYLGDGSAWREFASFGRGQIYVQETEPEGTEGDIWVDTSGI